ncbi:MAG: FAD-binding oxidoreductase, partial [Alphaproteobacteria bacterium]|nr:FAD-binding oxidoreductase [Alphaproteobacteria bacterium]
MSEIDWSTLRSIVGAENLNLDPAERAYVSQDYFARAEPVAAVVVPTSTETLSRAVAWLTERGFAIYPRGAGFSYTNAYLPTRQPGVSLDLRKMNRVLEINPTDMYVTAEAGCTWRALDEALAAHGVRTPFWGPLSGRYATLGGSISQGSVSLGSGSFGPSADSVLGLRVIAADGTIVTTGSGAQPGFSPFFRHYGPDLTGPFCGDAGALGIKATVTLRLIKRPAQFSGVSFGFDDFDHLVDGMAAAARLSRVGESLGMARMALAKAATTSGLLADIKMGLDIAKSAGLGAAARIALAGRRFLNGAPQTAHFTIEAHDQRELAAVTATLRRALSSFGAEMVKTVPAAMRANPFAAYDMVSFDGRRQLPMHAILPFSRAADFDRRLDTVLANHGDRLKALAIEVLRVYAGVGSTGFLYEPVILWNDTPEEFHRRHSNPATLAKSTA